MNVNQRALNLFKKSGAKKRKRKYKYYDGTMTVRVTPKKLGSQEEMSLCAMLVKHLTIKEAAYIMQVSPPTLSRAVRAHHYMNQESK